MRRNDVGVDVFCTLLCLGVMFGEKFNVKTTVDCVYFPYFFKSKITLSCSWVVFGENVRNKIMYNDMRFSYFSAGGFFPML